MAAATTDLRKTAFLTLSSKKGHKHKHFYKFFLILVLSILEIIMQKKINQKQIILSAPKTAMTLIIAATLNIAPTVLSSQN